MEEINKVLTGRKVIENYQAAHTEFGGDTKRISGETTKMKVELADIGFASVSDFYEANKQANIAEAKRCYRIIGHCDGCKGRKKGCINLPCSERDKAFTVKEDVSFDDVVINFFQLRNFPNHAPPNCSIRAKEIHKPKFDIYWGFPPAWTPEELAKLVEKYPWQATT